MFHASAFEISGALVLAFVIARYVGGALHELGHAVWGLRKVQGVVYVLICDAKPGSRGWRLGRLTVGFGTGTTSRAVFSRSEMEPRDQLICALLGPGTELLLSAASFAAAWLLREDQFLGWMALFTAMILLLSVARNLWPRREGRDASDGWVIRNVLRGGTGRPSIEDTNEDA